MIVLAAESTAGSNLGGVLVVIVIGGLFWLIQDVSKKTKARSAHLRARRSLTSSQRRALARIDRSAKAYNGSTKDLWGQFAAFKGNPKAFGKDAAALHKTYKASKKK
ncbi:hypothetical protein [Nocardioides panzhihuensis]|uniref:Uncharacterized protein n=1 Tax=Nocardioides panzhihuensis TaxID=860243 RepID=A0A7Z0DMQ7_9ACTN|nr:hypothetical protein [Nocardioides panzhihuensis]NYI78479.1 hypothetical protein [Nocardioides panzhihuensis]